MDEILRRFVAWIKIKAKIHLSDRTVYFREGEIWWVNLGANVGHEEEGKNDNFERPVLVLKKFNKHLLWAVPLTTKVKEENRYYFEYVLSDTKYAAVLSQLRVLSSKRLIRRIGMFPQVYYDNLRVALKKLI